MAEAFKVGDTVQLKSGGPIMTIAWIGVPLGGDTPIATCLWFNGAAKQKDTFPPDTLTKHED
ncbi:YodC family protein [Azospirillum sp. B2RO_4]|uniref:YodC family protein n=1 Tax=Azospirillum sp. B2RO_4 TaxID=3027796 RepID=UPI003DA82A22